MNKLVVGTMKRDENKSTVYVPFPDEFQKVYSFTIDGVNYINTNYNHVRTQSGKPFANTYLKKH